MHSDQIIAALRLYDTMLTKNAEEDSDDEQDNSAAMQAAVAASKAATPTSPSQPVAAAPTPAAAAPAAEPASRERADSLTARVGRMNMKRHDSNASFGELDKIRDRQRTEIYRENRRREAAGMPTPGIYGDLQGLNFPGNSTSRLPEPMAPKHAVDTRDRYGQGNLSDYSDY